MELGSSELSNVSINKNDIKLSFNLKEFPNGYPKKWDVDQFNAVHVVLEFGGVIDFLSSGSHFGWLDAIDITENDGRLIVDLKSGLFKLRIVSKFLTVRSIKPYEDVRW